MDSVTTINIDPALSFLGIVNLVGATPGLRGGSAELEGLQRDCQPPSCGADFYDFDHCQWSGIAHFELCFCVPLNPSGRNTVNR